MTRVLSALAITAAACTLWIAEASAGPTIKLKLQTAKPLTKSSGRAMASFAMSESPMAYASDSKSRSYGVNFCKIVKGKGKCSLDLSVPSVRMQGTITITPSYGKVGGKRAIKSFRSAFEVVTTCAGGSCGTPKVLDVSGSLWHRWDAADGEYDETKRTMRQVARES
ncbi:MAG TPA: hypothetical protein PKB03_04315 [Baekduia sp.]|nr:hypothetical protein [Baekduia sp.]